MPDYIYLLENRLSNDQRNALRQLREAARDAGTILFLTGDAVRDLTSGHAVRDLEVAVHGNALKLKKTIEKLGGKAWGEDEASRSLYLCFPGTVRVDVISTHRVEYPKPGKGVIHPASIQEDLRRRDFTGNAMAISLNEGSYGLLMDPLNGAADIEARALRLVSNYGFLEEPSLLIRATRYHTRLGWEMDPKTQARYENAKGEGAIEYLSEGSRSRELEQIGHEEDGLKVLRALEAEGWMKVLFPAWTSAKADEEKLKELHELAVELLMEGVHADMSAAQMRLLTAGLTSRELTALQKHMLRPGFVEEWNSLDALAAGFAKVLLAKENSTPSASFKLFTSYDPEAILWLGFTTRDAAVKEHFNQFLKVWPEARQRIPHALMQELRITHELVSYPDIVRAVFLELIDGRLTTPEEIRAFLEPHSPPAPPPRETIKRPRAKRGAESKLKEHSYEDDEEAEDSLDEEEDLDDVGGDEEEVDLGLSLPKVELEPDLAEEVDLAEDDLEAEETEPVPVPVKRAGKGPGAQKADKEAATQAPVPASAENPAAARPASIPAGQKAKEAEKPQASPKPKGEAKPAPAARPAAVSAKPQEILSKTQSTPAASPTKTPAVLAVNKAAPAPVAAKGSKGGKPVSTPPAAVKSAAKPPAKSDAISVKPPASAPDVSGKSPASAKALSVKPPALSVKPPAAAPSFSVKPPAVPARPAVGAKALSVKPPSKAPTAKVAAAKGKPAAKAASKAGKKPPPAKPSKPTGKKAAAKAGKRR